MNSCSAATQRDATPSIHAVVVIPTSAAVALLTLSKTANRDRHQQGTPPTTSSARTQRAGRRWRRSTGALARSSAAATVSAAGGRAARARRTEPRGGGVGSGRGRRGAGRRLRRRRRRPPGRRLPLGGNGRLRRPRPAPAMLSCSAVAAEDTERLSSDASVARQPVHRRPDDVVAGAVQVAELLDGAQPLRRDRALDGVLQVGRELPVHVAGDQDAAVDVLLLLRPLLGHLGDHPVVDVAVQLVERDVAVLVQVGGAAADRLDQVAGEHRRRPRAAQVVALEGVLGRVRRGQDGAPLALEPLEGLHALVGLRRAARRGRRRCSSSPGSAPCAASARRPWRR